jgi:hypothetical protein
MEQNAPKSTLGLLSKLGVAVDGEIAGMHCTAAAATNVPNVWQLTLQNPDGTGSRIVFAGKKSFDEGLLVETDKGIRVADNFEVYNNQGKMFIRNKSRQNSLADIKAI